MGKGAGGDKLNEGMAVFHTFLCFSHMTDQSSYHSLRLDFGRRDDVGEKGVKNKCDCYQFQAFTESEMMVTVVSSTPTWPTRH